MSEPKNRQQTQGMVRCCSRREAALMDSRGDRSHALIAPTIGFFLALVYASGASGSASSKVAVSAIASTATSAFAPFPLEDIEEVAR